MTVARELPLGVIFTIFIDKKKITESQSNYTCTRRLIAVIEKWSLT